MLRLSADIHMLARFKRQSAVVAAFAALVAALVAGTILYVDYRLMIFAIMAVGIAAVVVLVTLKGRGAIDYASIAVALGEHGIAVQATMAAIFGGMIGYRLLRLAAMGLLLGALGNLFTGRMALGVILLGGALAAMTGAELARLFFLDQARKPVVNRVA